MQHADPRRLSPAAHRRRLPLPSPARRQPSVTITLTATGFNFSIWARCAASASRADTQARLHRRRQDRAPKRSRSPRRATPSRWATLPVLDGATATLARHLASPHVRAAALRARPIESGGILEPHVTNDLDSLSERLDALTIRDRHRLGRQLACACAATGTDGSHPARRDRALDRRSRDPARPALRRFNDPLSRRTPRQCPSARDSHRDPGPPGRRRGRRDRFRQNHPDSENLS